jgi:hypothetical protein
VELYSPKHKFAKRNTIILCCEAYFEYEADDNSMPDELFEGNWIVYADETKERCVVPVDNMKFEVCFYFIVLLF